MSRRCAREGVAWYRRASRNETLGDPVADRELRVFMRKAMRYDDRGWLRFYVEHPEYNRALQHLRERPVLP